MEGANELKKFFDEKDTYSGDIPLFPLRNNGTWISYWVRVGDPDSEEDAVRTLQLITIAWKTRNLDNYFNEFPAFMASHAHRVKNRFGFGRSNANG
jgi:hypothetical protein